MLLGLQHARGSNVGQAGAHASQRAVEWLLAMQGADGGWAAFDVDNNWELLSSFRSRTTTRCWIRTCPDITGRVLEGLMATGMRADHAGGAARRGVPAAARRKSTEAGTGAGAWITFMARSWRLRGLRAAGEGDREAHILRAGEWLRSIQNADGGWGESCASYDNRSSLQGRVRPRRPRGPCWDCWPPATLRRVAWSPELSGWWSTSAPTEVGMRTTPPELVSRQVFYLKYHLYETHFLCSHWPS